MKKIFLLLPAFLLAGVNSSYPFRQGYNEGSIIKQTLFGRVLNSKEVYNRCLNAWQKDSVDKAIKNNKSLFLQGCEEALKSSGF